MKNKDKGRLPAFVPLLKETLNTPAWKAMSHGARSLYIALKCRYNRYSHNNGRLYLSQRQAEKEIGSHTDQVTRWFGELEHYGFIAKTAPGCLWVDGKGQAPRWLLTELGYMKEPPTKDLLRWNGVRFDKPKKQNPVPESRDAPSRKTGTPPSRKTGTIRSQTVPENRDKEMGETVPESRDKSSLTTGWAAGDLPKAPAEEAAQAERPPVSVRRRAAAHTAAILARVRHALPPACVHCGSAAGDIRNYKRDSRTSDWAHPHCRERSLRSRGESV